MYLSANLWIGSQESWEEAVDTRFWEFLFSRLSIIFLVGLIFALISLLINGMYWWKQRRDKSKVKYSVIYEIAFTFIAAIVFVAIAMK